MIEVQQSAREQFHIELEPAAPLLPAAIDCDEPVALQSFANQFDSPDLRQKLMSMEAFMLEQPQVEVPVRHHFCNGVYAREMAAPAGLIITGLIHKTEHLNIMSQGEISVLTEDGMVRLTAPCTLISKPGTKRIAYVHKDVVWTTVHATTETDLAKIEAELVTRSFDDADAEQTLIEMKES